MKEAPAIFKKTADDVVSTHVTTKDFQDWWLTANEDIQSSKSGCTFSHCYKAAAHSSYLSALHCVKLNLALKTGTLLEQWDHGLTVLLEKEFGSNYIDKLRAICLFEADFNWLQKLIIAKRTIGQARDKSIISDEQIAKAGTSPNEGTMIKVLHNDIHRTLHIPSAVVSADLANCYDAVNHAICSIALQAFGVSIMAIRLMLSCLQTVYFWLLTAFGVADKPFHGTPEFPFFGLGQGKGMTPGCFTVDSTLMINAYKRLGYGCHYTSCVTGVVFFLAAVLYVDDTDLLLRVSTPRQMRSDKDFFTHIQNTINDWGRPFITTGGSLKPIKSYVSVNSYKFQGGKGILTLTLT